MGLLDAWAAQSERSVQKPLQALPRTAGERFEATFSESFAPDRYFTRRSAERDLWQRSVDELHGATGESFVNPFAAMTPEEMMRLGNQPAVEQERKQKIIDASRLARASGNDALFDPENIGRYIAEEATRRRDKAASYVDTGNGLAAFAGSMAGETLTPHGVAGLAIPITRLPSAASLAVGKTFMGNVLREGAFQAGANAGLQGVAELFDAASRREYGTEQTTGEVLTNIAGAGVMGGLLGSGARALHLAWLRLPERIRTDAPTEVKDAFRVIENEAIYSGQNRLGIDPLLHERYQGNAMDAVMRGRPVDLSQLSQSADTPLTAVGRALSAPDAISVRGLEGIGTAMDRVRALPDQELEAVARQLKPTSFQQLDAVDAKLQALDQRVAVLRAEAEQIGVADVVDIDSAARLQDIETRLEAKGLRRAERQDLERERQMITETLGPEASAQLKAMRKEFFPEHAARLRAIDEERAALMKERTLAAGEARREVDFLRGKIEQISFRADPSATPEAIAKSADDIYREMRSGRKPSAKVGEVPGPQELPEFTRWFEGSQVVNPDGSPRIVYHGTLNAFEDFDVGRLGAATDAPSAREGIFFAGNPNVANSYAYSFNPYRDDDGILGAMVRWTDKLTLGYYGKFNDKILVLLGKEPHLKPTSPNVRPAYVSMKNPKVVDQKGAEYRDESYFDIIRDAKANGHDGVIIKNTYDPGWGGDRMDDKTDVYVVFSPDQTRAFTERFEAPVRQATRDVALDALDAPSLTAALERADLMRQARIFREAVPAGPRVASRTETAAEVPDLSRALDTETARLIETNADREVSIDGRALSAGDAMAEADRMDKDAQAALACAMGAL